MTQKNKEKKGERGIKERTAEEWYRSERSEDQKTVTEVK